jgi:hypothetical protein
MGSSGGSAHADTALDIRRQLSTANEVAVIGSSSFWHHDSAATCRHIGKKLAELSSLAIVTGGMEGVGETVARTFFDCLPHAVAYTRVFHLLPVDFDPIDFGRTIFVGEDVAIRREVLGRVSNLYLVIEGGPVRNTNLQSQWGRTPHWCQSDDPVAALDSSTHSCGSRSLHQVMTGKRLEVPMPQ